MPFNEINSEDIDNCYLIADVDEDSYEYVHKSQRNAFQPKPHVGVTPYTRFRRAPTLDIIRSTKMPLPERQNFHPQYSTNSSYLSNVNFPSEQIQVAKF